MFCARASAKFIYFEDSTFITITLWFGWRLPQGDQILRFIAKPAIFDPCLRLQLTCDSQVKNLRFLTSKFCDFAIFEPHWSDFCDISNFRPKSNDICKRAQKNHLETCMLVYLQHQKFECQLPPPPASCSLRKKTCISILLTPPSLIPPQKKWAITFTNLWIFG